VNLGETYRRSTIPQLKVLIGSVFLSQVAWNYTGTLDCMISPLYQYIRDFSGNTAPSGAGDTNYFELIYSIIYPNFNKLMEVYLAPCGNEK